MLGNFYANILEIFRPIIPPPIIATSVINFIFKCLNLNFKFYS